MIKSITIDFWNTLFDSSNGVNRHNYRQNVFCEVLKNNQIELSTERFDEAMKETWKYFEDNWINNHRTPSSADCVAFIWDYLDIKIDQESEKIIIDAFEDSVLVHPPVILPQVKDSLDYLSEKYSLAIISDTGFSPGTILKELMVRHDIEKYFSSFSFSNETGAAKPNELAFKSALNPLNCKPENSIHIGDIEDTDIVGAKNMGMKAIRFVGSSTEYLSRKNKETTLADIELNTWNEIIEFIEKIDV